MQISVIPNHQPAVIVHPPKAAFNDPTPAVSLSHTDGSATTGFGAFSLNGGNGGRSLVGVTKFGKNGCHKLCQPPIPWAAFGDVPAFAGPEPFSGWLPLAGFHDGGRCPDTDRSAPRFHPIPS